MTHDFSKINKVVKDTKKHNLNQDKMLFLQSKYFTTLNGYVDKYKLQGGNLTILRNPLSYFAIMDYSLLFMPNRVLYGKQDFFEFLKISFADINHNSDDAASLYQALFDFIKICKTNTIDKHAAIIGNYLMKFEDKNRLGNVEILTLPHNYFKLIDGNLCYLGSIPCIVTNIIAKKIFVKHNLFVPSNSMLKSIMSVIKKHLKNMLDDYNKELKNIEGKNNNPFYINYCDFVIIYNRDKKCFEKLKGINDASFQKTIEVSNLFINDKLYTPTSFLHLLYLLTKGNTRILDQIAILCAKMFCSSKVAKGLTIIQTTENNTIVYKFLTMIVNNKIDAFEYKQMFGARNICKLVNSKLNGFLACFVFGNAPVGNNAALFNELQSCKPIYEDSSFTGKITFLNNMHFISMEKDPNILSKLAEDYKPEIIHLINESIMSDEAFAQIKHTASDIAWMRTVFALHGLKLIAEGKNKAKYSHIENKNILKNFISKCCNIQAESLEYTDDLYGYFTEYYKKLYGGEPISRIIFTKVMKSLKMLEYDRPNKSRKVPNRRGFLGIKFDEDKFKKFMATDWQNLTDKVSYEDFQKYLANMNSLYPSEK